MIGKNAPGLDTLKWLALALMAGDHINWALYGRELPALSEAARVVMPIFALILAYNLARPSVDLDTTRRTLGRLVLGAAVATPLYIVAFGVVLPLNVLWTFAVAVCAIALLREGHRWVATVVVIVAGGLVDYLWPGVCLTLAGWHYFRYRSIASMFAIGVSLLGVCAVNGNLWALWSVPILWLGHRLDLGIARNQMAFYVFYPAHIALLAVARLTM